VTALLGAGLALTGVLTGLAWRIPAVERLDRRLFARINEGQYSTAVDGLLRLLRPLGTSWGLLGGVLGILLFQGWREAALLLAVTALSGGVERALKLTVGRKRPFETLPGVRMRVPPPTDPSFPSGDASRAWYLASAIAFGLALPAWVAGVLFGLAGLVSYGRVRGGAHFPTDAWAGSWLGMGMGLIWVALAGLLSPA
jgi:undecaprenyl-diphosphatase